MSIKCKECDMEFHTQGAADLHSSIFHKEEVEKKPEKKTAKKARKKPTLSPDGKPQDFQKWVARMERKQPLGYGIGDKVSMNQLKKDLSSYKLTIEERLSGRAPFYVKESKEEIDERIYVLESSAFRISWKECKPFEKNKALTKAKKERWYITSPRINTIDFIKKKKE